MKKILKFFRTFLLVLGSMVFMLIVSEVFVRFYFYKSEDRDKGVRALYIERQSAFAKDVTGSSDFFIDCHFLETIKAHPFLGYVHKTDGKCSPDDVNSQGFIGERELLNQKDQRYFDVLVVGGSVATALASSHNEKASFLETALKKLLGDIDGRSLRVFNGSFSGWRLPQQAIMSLHYGSFYDAILSIDGFNEMLNPSSFGRVDPALYYSLIHHEEFGSQLGSLKQQIRLWNKVHKSSFGSSYLIDFAFDRLLQITSRSIEIDEGLSKDEILFHNLSKQERKALFVESYIDRIKAMAAISQSRGQRFVHFLQPIPNLAKQLTPDEKSELFPIDVELYKNLATQLELKIPEISYNLTGVFFNEESRIYSDRIHCRFDQSGESYGYSLISDEVARLIGDRSLLN